MRLGLLGTLGLVLTGCSAQQREALAGVDPRRVRVDRDTLPGPRPRPSDRELRRRSVLGGAIAARRTYLAVGTDVPPLLGRAGGAASLADAVAVHYAHLVLLGAAPVAGSAVMGRVPAEHGGPALPPGGRPAAVLGAGGAAALAASWDERAAEDVDVDLSLLHARVASARAAQTAGLRGTGAADVVWPTGTTTAAVVGALQGLLAQEHRSRWSYAVVLAWCTDRTDDAAGARADHTRRAEALASVILRLGASPVGARATYPTDEDGRPVDGPRTATALALRLEEAVTVATAAVLATVVVEGQDDWTAATVTALAESERSRWSWGGVPQDLPGG